MAKRRNRLTKNPVSTEVTKAPVPTGSVGGTQFMGLSSQYVSPRRGTRELLHLYGESPWLRAIVNKVSRAVAEVDWALYARKGVDGKYVIADELLKKNGPLFEQSMKRSIDRNELTEVRSHPLLNLLDSGTGNPRLNGHSVFQITQSHLDLTGEGFWLLEKDNLGTPVHAWPLPPPWIANFPSEKNPYYQVSVPGGAKIDIPFTEIVPFIEPSPENPYGRGIGISQSLDDEIQIDEYSAKHMKSFFLNRARPDIIISGQFISPSDATRLEQQWLSDHQGFWKSFKPLFFSQKIDVKELSQTFESMQMVQVRKHERDTFISVFGLPPEKMGVIGESKRSTIAAADYFWTKDVIKPRIELMRRSLQQVLVPQFDERLILYYDTPVVQDDEHRLEIMKVAPWTVKINEWRNEMGLESLGPTGEAVVIPMNMLVVPVQDIGGTPVEPTKIFKDMLKAVQERGYVPEVDPRSIANIVSDEILSELRSSFDGLKIAIEDLKGE